MTKSSWGLVLSGGGGKGAYEVGAIKAILETGINITAVAGASVGALNAALFATYDIESIIQIWQGITPQIALSQDRLGDLIRANGIPWLIEESEISCHINAYNILTAETNYFLLNRYRGEDVVKLLLASSAMPIIYPPVFFDDTLYWDGGLLDNTPIDVLYREGYRNLLVIYLSPGDQSNKYKDANIIPFAPKENMGFFDGTLNFEQNDIQERIITGYVETKQKLVQMKQKTGS